MRRRVFLRKCILSAGAVAGAPMLNFGRCRLFAGTRGTYSVRTVDVVGRSLVIDMLGLLTLDWPRLRTWQAHPATFQQQDFAAIQRSGINVFHPAVSLDGPEPYAHTAQWLRAWRNFIDAKPDQFAVIRRCEDITTTRENGTVGILLGMQDSTHFRGPADVLEFHALGQRVSQVTYNGPNRIGHGWTERRDAGLSVFGESIIQAMNACGMAVDVSHAAERTTLDTFEASSRPVLITHANCRALTPHPRCKSDTVIRAMARKGGVMGITSVREFVRRRREGTLEEALDHFDHVVRLVGVEHAGIGSDTDISPRPRQMDAAGLNTSRRIFDIAEGLLRRKYMERDVELILGGNFHRVLGEIFC